MRENNQEHQRNHRATLEKLAEARIESGELPAGFRGITHAGTGSGRSCDLCRRLIEKDGVEYEVEWHKGETVRVLRFHLECFQAWLCSDPEHPN